MDARVTNLKAGNEEKTSGLLVNEEIVEECSRDIAVQNTIPQ